MERAAWTTRTNTAHTDRPDLCKSKHCGMFHLFSHCWHWIQIRQEPIRPVTIIFLGLDNAGKSSIIRVIRRVPPCQVLSSAHVDPFRTEIRLDRFDLTLLEMPGGQKNRASWRLYYTQAHALVFVVDASDPGRMKEVACVLASVLRHPCVAGKPLLILANKQDKSSSLLTSEIIELLSLETLVNENKTHCRIEPCSAGAEFSSQHDWGVLKALRWVLRSVMLSYPMLAARVLQESSEERIFRIPSVRGPLRTQDGRMLTDSISDLVEYKSFPVGKKRPLKPIQNILTQTGQNLGKVKKRKRKVRVKETNLMKEDEDDNEMEGRKLSVEQKLSPFTRAQKYQGKGHGTVILPQDEQKEQATGTRKRKKKKKGIPKNQIISQDGATGDMSNTFDLYRRAMQALKLKQEQQRSRSVHKSQGVNPIH
ncbi:hypothetical protein XENTR_v10020698 [Xenopus tropicalis]|uniref:ADP ribosylation factor-like GTPase 13A n=1 Tax=Xenopus tropicalis TaxID=8364 RepID=A0A6I8PS67_XENTR|nr:ADP-ribosylation factor-like protein 13A [Xenopus tropicalis]XP_004916818.1 ADP-ribosylation factor-like protein 13A [Xenopus tropicalis]KAE8583802.1 hypothetical protein XENTR_v10020698 [Xenopus tropicalis]KAE8583803.1 hypothetical protein XENTR_v10020698 [Xenopus tropicalis]|eukprot:XP_004916817.1 PREDICTED: ADP-ribosylation factor-like protein 13A [Xenopus tropicalis]